MPACIERVVPRRIDGWAYLDAVPDERLAMELRFDGQVVATTRAEHYREDLKRNGLGDGCYGYRFTDVEVPNLPGAFLAGRVEVRALPRAQPPEVATAADYLKDQVDGALRRVALETLSFAAFLAHALSTQSLEPAAARRALHLVNAARAHFPEWAASVEFLRLGANLAKGGGQPHTRRFYESRLQGLMEPAAPRQVPAPQPILENYGTLSELAQEAPDIGFDLVEPQFLTGGHRQSFLEEAGILRSGPGARRVKLLAYREDAFGGEGWWVKREGRSRPVARNLYYLDFERLHAVLDEGGFLLIDLSNEGPLPAPDWIERLNQALAELGVPPRQTLFVNQNLKFEAPGTPKLHAHVTVGHYFIAQSIHVLQQQLPDERAIAGHGREILAGRAAFAEADLKHYLCLNFTPRWFRWATVLHLSLHGQLDQGFVSFPGRTNFKLPVALDLEQSFPEMPERAALLAEVPRLLARCPLELDVKGSATTSPDFDHPIPLMTQSLFQIVTESELTDGTCMRRVTEKILKPIVGLQPFLIIGNPKSLALLKSMGFRTFEGLIDERYDAIPDPAQRLAAVFAEIDRLTALPLAELRARVAALEDTLIHNLAHLMQVGPRLFHSAAENRIKGLVAAQRRPDEATVA
jgi:hypothetical protein